MLNTVETKPGTTAIIENDNCSQQYNSCAHFESIQRIANDYGFKILRVFGILEHGKGEVDHVGGVSKTTIRPEIAAGEFYSDAGEMVEMLRNNNSQNTLKKLPPQLYKRNVLNHVLKSLTQLIVRATSKL